MQIFVRIDKDILPLLACPICKYQLVISNHICQCNNNKCQASFPIIEGRPILINEKNSLFHINDYTDSKFEDGQGKRKIWKLINKFTPSITHNWVGPSNYAKLAKLLCQRNYPAIVLIVGGGELGVGLENLLNIENIKLVETDVYFGSRTMIVADGHDLPFLDQSFDAVVIQAVLEHVLDPYRCVAEVHRVLKPDGIVYAETPFMYPVHMGTYDFTRFSLNAHRRLFRNFVQTEIGVASGPGQALALSIRSFVLSLSTSFLAEAFAIIVLPFFTFWLKYFDYFLITKPHVEDFASTVYFLGKKAEKPIKDEEIINTHWSRRISTDY